MGRVAFHYSHSTSMQSLNRSSTSFITSPKAPRAPTSPFATLTQPRQPFQQPKQSNRRTMATDRGELKIESQNIKTAPGVELSAQQQTLVGSVLDLFAGRPSLPKLGLWKDDAEFTDPLTIAKGREKYEAQWYGLQAVFSEIERLSHEVKSSGNPIVMDMSTRYVVKGLGKEQKINSVVEIHTEGDKITKVADMWDGKLPDGAISNVSSLWTLGNPFWWFHYAESCVFYAWSFTWETSAWRVGQACSPSWLPCLPFSLPAGSARLPSLLSKIVVVCEPPH